MGRRGKGEGTIFKLPNGQWCAMLDTGYDTHGKRQRKKITGKTRQEVAQKLNDLRRKQQHGVALGKQQPLHVLADQWLEDVVKPSLRPKSYTTYDNIVQRYIIPLLGEVPLDKITPQRVQMLLSKLIRDGAAPKTVALVRTTLKGILKQAVTWRLIDHNPVEGTSAPRCSVSAGSTITPEQAHALMEESRSERQGTAITLALSLGLRRGELAGLRWEDVDLVAGTLTVTSTLGYVPGQGLVRGEPKTASGRRTLPLPAFLIAALSWHKSRQHGEHTLMEWKPAEFVFTNTVNGGALNGDALYKCFKRCAARAGLPPDVRFHDLRHSCASFLLSQNVPLKTVSAILGHANVSITMNTYAHLLPGDLERATNTLAQMLDPTRDDQKTGS